MGGRKKVACPLFVENEEDTEGKKVGEMTSEVMIREVRQEECEVAADIAVEAWEGIYEGYRASLGEDLYEAVHANWRKKKRGDILRMCGQEEDKQVRVAEAAGEVVGFVTFSLNAESLVGQIVNMAVRSDQRGKGIAGRLLDRAMAELKGKRARAVVVRTGLDAAHAPARRCYEKAGFEVRLDKTIYVKRL